MLKISLIEFFLRVVPEAFIFFLGIYILSWKCINKKAYIKSSIIYSLSVYLIRMLPISLGVHTIILIMICSLICIYVNNIPTNEAVSNSFILMLILMICEMINIFVVEKFLNMNLFATNDLVKVYVFYPSLILFVSIIYLIHFLRKKCYIDKIL